MQKRSKFQIRSDAAKQRWVRDERKEAFWRKHITAWRQSGESKRGYCIRHNLSESSFNAWNREISIRDREKMSSANAMDLLSGSAEVSKNPFVPLRLLLDEATVSEPGPPHVESKPEASTDEQARERRRIEILVPGGAVIRIDEACNPRFVGELFSTLKGLEQC